MPVKLIENRIQKSRNGIKDNKKIRALALDKYILGLKDYPNDTSSFINYGSDGSSCAIFWYEDGNYKLVLQPDGEDSATKEYSDFWADAELNKVNEEKLTSKQLYNELVDLPYADLINYHGLNELKYGGQEL